MSRTPLFMCGLHQMPPRRHTDSALNGCLIVQVLDVLWVPHFASHSETMRGFSPSKHTRGTLSPILHSLLPLLPLLSISLSHCIQAPHSLRDHHHVVWLNYSSSDHTCIALSATLVGVSVDLRYRSMSLSPSPSTLVWLTPDIGVSLRRSDSSSRKTIPLCVSARGS